jgi:hypothetical protein
VGSNFKYGSDVRLAIQNLFLPILIKPADPVAGANLTQHRIWEKQVDEFMRCQMYLTENMKTMYSLCGDNAQT